ncbi:MAG: protein kinase [archaeon]|nr:protein kinase [archaeon]
MQQTNAVHQVNLLNLIIFTLGQCGACRGENDAVDLSKENAIKENSFKDLKPKISVEDYSIEERLEMSLTDEGQFPFPFKKITSLKDKFNLFKEDNNTSILPTTKIVTLSPNKKEEESSICEETLFTKKQTKLNNVDMCALTRTKTFNFNTAKKSKVRSKINKLDRSNNNLNISLHHGRSNVKNLSPSTKQTTKTTNNCGIEKEDISIKLINDVLNKSKIFREKLNEDKDLLNYLSENFIECSLNDQMIIFNRGDISKFFFIIKKGIVELINEEGEIERKEASKTNGFNIKENNYFGEEIFEGDLKEESLKEESKHNQSAICKGEVILLGLYKGKLKNYLSKMDTKSFKEKLEFLSNQPMFKSLNPTYKFILADKSISINISKGKNIKRTDALSTSLFLVFKGKVSLYEDEEEINRIEKGNYFGFDSFIKPREEYFNIQSMEDTELIQFKKDTLKDIFGEDCIKYLCFNLLKEYLLKKSKKSFYEKIFGNVLDKLFKKGKLSLHNKGEILKGEGEDKKIYLILEVNSLSNDLSPGNIIGEEYLYEKNTHLKKEYKLSSDIFCHEINFESVKEILKEESENEIYYNEGTYSPLKLLRIISQLKKIQIFKYSSLKVIEEISPYVKKIIFPKSSKIIEENTNNTFFYMIIKGRVKVTKNGKTLRYLDEGSSFGERISLPNSNHKRSATIIAETDKVICYQLNENYLQNYILKDENTFNYIQSQCLLEMEDIKLEDLYYIKFLGKGKFGNVYLVHNNKNKYAIKTVSRLAVNKQKHLGKYFETERKIMLYLDHPFIVKLVKTMKNNLYCFFLIEYIKGIPFSEYISKRQKNKKPFTKEEFKFYIGNMSIAIGYLQKNLIANRDIKPSNTMLENTGYLKLIDFGTAKEMKDYTKTTVGTPHYMAPEILEGKGYSMYCDYWSLGICAYEMYYNRYPFGNNCNGVNQVYEQILYSKLIFPQSSEDNNDINNFISGLLQKKVNERLCTLDEIKENNLFKDFSWEDFENLKMKPPFVLDKTEKEIKLEDYQTKFEDHVHEDYYEKSILTDKRNSISGLRSVTSINELMMNHDWAQDF